MQITVTGQHIAIVDDTLVSNSVNIYECEFEFDSSWDGFAKTSVWQLNSDEPIEVVIDSGVAVIPHEVLENAGILRIGVYGTKDEKVMPTVWLEKRKVCLGTPTGSIGTEPTPSIYAQILAVATEAKDTAEEVQTEWESVSATAETLPSDASATANFDGEVFSFGIPQGQQGERGERGIQGETGNGIASITKTATVGKVDTYTITYTDGTTTTFDVTNGEVTEAQFNPVKDDLDAVISDVLETDYDIELIAQNTESVPTTLDHVTGYLIPGDGSTAGKLSGTGNTNNHTWYILAAEDMDVYPAPISYADTDKCRIGVFSGQPYGASNRVTPVYQAGNADYPLPTVNTPLHVETGQYLSISFYNAGTNPLWELYKVTDASYALKSTTPLSPTQNDEVDAKIKNSTDDINDDGYQYLEGTWARGEWTSYSSHSSRTYRVRLEEPISFNRDVYLMASQGFYFTGVLESGDTFGGEKLGYILPSNTKAKINVRRITEDSSETANLAEFSKGIKVATLCAGIELYKPTFTDVSMFERMGVGGDSYAAGGGIISGIRPLTWGKNLERQAGINVDIYAKSGQTVVQWVTDATNGLPALLAGTECGLYWLQHGINGTSTAEALGTSADMSASPHPQTFYGQYVEAIEQIQSAFPNARIVLATITGSSYGLYQTLYANVNTAIREIAEYCNVPVVDIIEDDFYKSLWYSDNIRSNHPTAMLCAGMAMANRRLIAKCIMDNPDYFVTYGSNS